MKQYEQIYDGEWFKWNWRGNKHQCCDCGLVHDVDYRVKNGHLEMRCYRNGRATGGSRRFKGAMAKKR